MTLQRDWIPSPNYSSRGGSAVRLIIIHTAEGALDYKSLGNFFSSSSSGVSSHVGIDDNPGRIGEYVKPANKAWTAGDANPYSVNVELCGFAAWSPAEWERHPDMLDNLARWIREESDRYGIPMVKVGGGGRGVCGHVDVSGPGGHWDPGTGLPYSRILEAAKTGGPVYGEPAPPPEPDPLYLSPALIGGLEDMPPDYLVHDTSTDNYFAAYPGGLVRLVTKAERDALAGVKVISAAFSDSNSKRYMDYDRALRGYLEKRD